MDQCKALRRGIGSVWGSGVAGVLCAVAALAGVPPGLELWQLGFVVGVGGCAHSNT